MNYFANIFLRLGAGNHDLMAALFAFNLEVHSRAQNIKGIAAAGMIFFHNKLIAYTNIHVIAPYRNPIPLYYNTFHIKSIELFVIIRNTNHIN